ncbi:hypothetical protein H8959_012736, partial [Pygathrix nigripes]
MRGVRCVSPRPGEGARAALPGGGEGALVGVAAAWGGGGVTVPLVGLGRSRRNLSKKYQPKKNSKEEEEYKYTSCKAFISTLNEMNDYAGQHEVISENMASQIIVDLARYVQELKQERKS